jgi:signal peptidase I
MTDAVNTIETPEIRHHRNRESLLETLESIVVAFVLAFVFRAFIVEAFVIPTGSMAPTLYGAHAEVTCADCGYSFAVGAENEVPPQAVCPNCLLQQEVTKRRPFSGDRILVLKYTYDFMPPQRWDVMVFHNPTEPAQNYIKRLVGLPGETLQLVNGNAVINGQIARKPDKAQDALWMLVHDTRYQPHRDGWKPRWVFEEPWRSKDTGFTMDSAPPGGQAAWLEYRHWVPRPGLDGGNSLGNITDVYGYDTAIYSERSVNTSVQGGAVCSELGLRTAITARDRQSVVLIRMRAYEDNFEFELTAQGSGTPTRIFVNGEIAAEAPEGVLPVGRSVPVQVANVDEKLVLKVGGRRPAKPVSQEWGTTAEGDILYTPVTMDMDRREYDSRSHLEPHTMATEVKIGGIGGPVDLAYLRLDRDVYYLNMGMMSSPENEFKLRDKEYYALGDNSPKSSDSRLWPLDRPVVPQRNLVGRAFFVYWPSAGSRWGIPVAPDPTGWRIVH